MLEVPSPSGPPPSADCLSDDDAAALVSGDLDDELRTRLTQHLDICEVCRRFVSTLAAAEAPTATTLLDTSVGPTGLRADDLLGRFRLTRPLGHGSMGEVWAALDPELDREVALKLLRVRPEMLNPEATTRMRREAQAMARLNHPNVVTIHELGADGQGRIFCAMELVDGATLRGWSATPRSWRAVMKVATAVGAALVAAHAAGLIHRDIKPENVLIDREGRPLVSDFGLAKLVDLSGEADAPRGARPNGAPLAVSLTTAGAVIGTPHYMAPEQLAGRPADARSDQFSYCVTIYEALFGSRPFRGASIEELEAAIARGPTMPTHLRGVPRGVLRSLVRGLAADPGARWPTMAALVHELERAAQRPRRRRIAVAVTLTACAAGAAITMPALLGSRDASSCAAGVQLIDDVWNPGVRDAQVAQLIRIDPDARVSITSATRLVDDWAAAWRLGRRAACAVEGAERTARRDCLEGNLHDLRAQLAVWHNADRAVVDTAVRAAAALPDLHDCISPPPGGEITATLTDQITKIDALVHSGRAVQAVALVAPTLATATATGNPRDLAVALVSAGRAKRDAGDLVHAREHLAQAAQEAGRAADDPTLLDALIDEAGVLVALGQPLVGLGLIDAAQALDRRSGARASQRIMLTRGGALQQAGRTEEAIAILRALLPAVEADAARDPRARLVLASLLAKLSAAQRQIEDYQGAFDTTTRALAIHEATLGPSHPEVARSLRDLANCERHLQRHADAKAHLARALDLALHGVAQQDDLLSSVYMGFAAIAGEEGRVADSRADFERARVAMNGLVAPDHPRFAVLEAGLGELERAQDRCKEAIPHFERAVHIIEVSGHDPRNHANYLVDLGYCLADVGRVDEGRNVLTRALAEYDDLHMTRRWYAEPYGALAEIEYGAGHREAAIDLARKSIIALADDPSSYADVLRAYMREQLVKWSK